MNLEKSIAEHKIIAILRNVPFEKTAAYIGAIYEGGIRLLEIALNSPDALAQIELARRLYDGKLAVGAGTAISVPLAQAAVNAGAQFLLSPSSGADLLEYCQNQGIALLPGVMTPTDVAACLKYGFNTLKLFPAGDLPPAYINSLKGPFSDTSYVAVGGVGAHNLREFLKRGFIGAGIGSGLIPKELIANDWWDRAAAQVAELVASIN